MQKNTANENSCVRKTNQNLFYLWQEKSIIIKNLELHNFNNFWNDWFKMNKIINKFLLTGDKFIPELHLKQAVFTYSASGQFTKHHKRIQKFRETSTLKQI